MIKTMCRVCFVAMAATVGFTPAIRAQTASYEDILSAAVNEQSEQFDRSLSEASTASVYGEDCDQCGSSDCGSSCCSGPGGLRDNLELFMGGDGWKNHGDDDDNNNFGYRLGANSAFGGSNIRCQIGGSYGFYDFHGREDADEIPSERQLFLTGGVYKRSQIECGDHLSWGVVYDYMNTNNWGESTDNLDLGQIRARIGYAINTCNEFGVWSAVGIDDDVTANLGNGVKVEAKDQINLYWLHNFELGGETMLYVGLADEPNGHLQDYDSPSLSEFVLGLRGRAPLSRKLALYGNVHYILPGTTGGDISPNNVDNSYAEEVWNVSIGLVFYPGAKARASTVSGNAGLPLLPVADNGTFAVNTPTGAL